MENINQLKALLHTATALDSEREARVEAMKSLDALAADRTQAFEGDLKHYLQRRSYQKAIDFLADV